MAVTLSLGDTYEGKWGANANDNKVSKNNGYWRIDQGEKFSITINCENELIAKKAKIALYHSAYLAEGYMVRGDLYCDLAELIVTNSIECLEIKKLHEENVEKYRKYYCELESKESSNSSKSNFSLQVEVTTKLKVPTSCAGLFEFDSSTSWIYKGDIISNYDPQALRFYIKRYNKFGKLWFVEPSSTFAGIALRCCNAGLARKGRDIPIEFLLNNLPVKVLSQALGEAHARRKSAIESILLQESPYSLLENVCDLDKYYEFFVSIDERDLTALNNAWKWAEITSKLLKNAVGASITVKDSGWIKRISKEIAQS